MKTYFAMHCLTKRNIDENELDRELAFWEKYDRYKTPEGEEPSKRDLVTGQVDIPLIYKGRCQAQFLGQQLLFRLSDGKSGKHLQIKIICADQMRCRETASIIADKLKANDVDAEIITDERLNARGYGKLAENAMDIENLKHFYKAKVKNMKEKFTICRTAMQYLVMPKKLGIEPKSQFYARVDEFFQDNLDKLDGVLIIGGSDVYSYLQERNVKVQSRTEELSRGELGIFDATAIEFPDATNKRCEQKDTELSL